MFSGQLFPSSAFSWAFPKNSLEASEKGHKNGCLAFGTILIGGTRTKLVLMSQMNGGNNPKSTELVHRPSPYMRRVRLPRLDFSIRQNAQYSHHLPYFMDNDLPSPEELIAKIELIQLKNKQINGNNHLVN